MNIKHLPLLAALVAAPVFAEGEQATCADIADLAKTIMERRQENVAMTALMGVTDNPLARKLIIAAYKQPSYSTPSYQQEAVSEFANSVALACYQSEQK